MGRAHTVFLVGDTQKDHAIGLVRNAPADWVLRMSEATRTDLQNRKLWPMLKDIQQQVAGMDVYSTDDIKLRFMNALGTEMRFLPELEGAGVFPVGMRSSNLTKAQFAGLLDLLYAYGAKFDVRWTDPTDIIAA